MHRSSSAAPCSAQQVKHLKHHRKQCETTCATASASRFSDSSRIERTRSKCALFTCAASKSRRKVSLCCCSSLHRSAYLKQPRVRQTNKPRACLNHSHMSRSPLMSLTMRCPSLRILPAAADLQTCENMQPARRRAYVPLCLGIFLRRKKVRNLQQQIKTKKGYPYHLKKGSSPPAAAALLSPAFPPNQRAFAAAACPRRQ